MTKTSGVDAGSLVATLAGMPDLVARLAEEHRDDGAGRCTGCRVAGYGCPGERWPCGPVRLAWAAQRFLAGTAPTIGSGAVVRRIDGVVGI